VVLFVFLLVEKESAFDEIKEAIVECNQNDKVVEGISDNVAFEFITLDYGYNNRSSIYSGYD
jgi:hypothetical protein